MPKIARITDTSSHGGTIISSSENVLTESKGVARKGDSHSCPISGHGVTELQNGSSSVKVNGKEVIRIGDQAGCGAVIQTGSATVSAGN